MYKVKVLKILKDKKSQLVSLATGEFNVPVVLARQMIRSL